jgi:hypothetical protein
MSPFTQVNDLTRRITCVSDTKAARRWPRFISLSTSASTAPSLDSLALGRVAILSVEGFPIMKEWYMVHRSGKRLSPIALAFHEFVLNEAEHIMKLPQPKPVTRSRRRVTRS